MYEKIVIDTHWPWLIRRSTAELAGSGNEWNFRQVLISFSALLSSSSISDAFDITDFLSSKGKHTVDDYSTAMYENTWLTDEIVLYYSMTICQRVDQKEKMTIDLLSFFSILPFCPLSSLVLLEQSITFK